MALTAVQIQARIDAIQASRDSGALVVRHGDTMTTFRSLSEMDQIIAKLKAELDTVNEATPRPRVGYITQLQKGVDGNLNGLFDDWS